MDRLINQIEDKNFTEEELGELAAKVLNLGTVSLTMFKAFYGTLEENNQQELLSRFGDKLDMLESEGDTP